MPNRRVLRALLSVLLWLGGGTDTLALTLTLVGPPDTPQLAQFRAALFPPPSESSPRNPTDRGPTSAAEDTPAWQVQYVPVSPPGAAPPRIEGDVVLTLGMDALQQVLSDPAGPPDRAVLSLYVSRRDFTTLAAAHPQRQRLTAVYADPPLARQVRLARLLQPRVARIAILSHRREPATLREPEGSGITLRWYAAEQWESLAKYLTTVIRDNDLLIGLEDPELFNSVNIKPILLSAYRHHKFLIGPNYAFVRAGSLATTYSSQTDTVREVRDILERYRSDRYWPAPDHARHFSVIVNGQVARSLNLVVESDDSLRQILMTQENGHD